MLAIHLQHQPAYASEEEATDPLAALAEVLASTTRLGLLWARYRNGLLPFDGGTIGILLAAERFLHADDPNRPTHVLSLCATPDGIGEIGVITLNVRSDTRGAPDAAAGLILAASLPEGSCEADPTDLPTLLERCVAAVAADTATIGPSEWVRELGVGYVTFPRRVRRDLLPVTAQLVASRSGSMIIAHRESPSSESAAARDAITGVRAAVHGGSRGREAPAAPGAAPGPAPAAPPIAPPGDSGSRPAERVGARAAGSTLNIDVAELSRGMLPFTKGAASPDLFAAADAERAERSERPLSETMELPVMGEPPNTPDEPGDRATMFLPPGAPPVSLPAMLTGAPPSASRDDSGSNRAGAPGTKTLASTDDVDMRDLLRELMPFVKGAPPPAAPRGHDTVALAAMSEIPVAEPGDRATVELKTSQGGPASTLTLEQYAALHAELSLFPERRASILERYGLNGEGALPGVDEQFGRWFEAVPAVRQRWRALATHYDAWFRRRSAASR